MTNNVDAYVNFIGKQVKQEEQGISATKIFKSEQPVQQPSADRGEDKVNAYANFISIKLDRNQITKLISIS